LLGDLDVQVLGALQVDHRGAFLGEDLEALDAWDERFDVLICGSSIHGRTSGPRFGVETLLGLAPRLVTI
jgi:hypothetical protein